MAWSREKIVAKIHAAADQFRNLNPQQYQQLLFVLERMPPEDTLEPLYSVFLDTSRPERRYRDHEYADKLLLAVKPPCPQELLAAIKGVLSNYNLSIKELPFYFAAVYGRQAVLRMLDGLSQEVLTPTERRSLSTFGYWLGGQDQAQALSSEA